MIPFLLFSLLTTFASFNHSEWDQFLKKFVNDKGEVNYEAAHQESPLLDTYLEKLKRIPLEEFNEWPREERMAVWINAYNAGVVKLVLHHYPVKTVMNIPGFWDQPAAAVGTFPKKRGGRINVRSLNQIENDYLRTAFRDEKIIFALSKGARGSSRLRQEAYKGPNFEGQLYLATKEFVNDETKNHIVPSEKKVVLSRIFKWNGIDFLFNWGDFPEENKWDPQEMAVLSFFAHYLEDPKKIEFLKEGKYKVKYENFNWDLNDWRKGKAKGKTSS